MREAIPVPARLTTCGRLARGRGKRLRSLPATAIPARWWNSVQLTTSVKEEDREQSARVKREHHRARRTSSSARHAPFVVRKS
jgi:hypothetical protein